MAVPNEATARVLTKVSGIRRNGAGWMAQCPAHDDHTASLAVTNGADGRCLLHCHAGCPLEAVLAAVGLDAGDLFQQDLAIPAPKAPRSRDPVAEYDYTDAGGQLAYQVIRFAPKDFRQRRPDGDGWSWSLAGVERVPYRLPELLAAPADATVYIPEGERDVDALAALGLVATCNSGGAGKWPPAFAAHLAGRTVVILPDNDEPGRSHAEQVRASLAPVAASVQLLKLPGLPDKGDVSDWLAAGGTVEQLGKLTTSVEASDIGERTGVRSLAAFSTDPPEPMVIDRLDPTGHTILFGPGGAGKGTIASGQIIQLAREGRRVLIVDYEHHPEEWARRIYGLGGADLIDTDLIQYVAPLSRHWLARRGPIWEQQQDLRELVVARSIDIIVIDSIGFACLGADVSDAATPQLYGAALELIDCMALSLAHVPKDGNLAFPFGSVFWHNGARATWSLVDNGTKRILTHRKHNNYAKQPTLQVDITWQDGRPVEIWERPFYEAIADRITRILAGGHMTAKQITAALNDEIEDEDERDISPDTVSRTLRRGAKSKPPRFTKEAGDVWATC